MPRVLDSVDPGSRPRSHEAAGRVSRGRTYLPLVSQKLRLMGLVLAVLPAGVRWEALRPSTSASAPDRPALAGHSLLVHAVVFAPDGRTLASCASDRTLRLWDAAGWGDGNPSRSDVVPFASSLEAVAFSPDGRTMVTSSTQSLTIWSRGAMVARAAERTGETFSSLAFAPDGRTLALGGLDGSVRLWEMPEARERAVLRESAGAVRALAFAPDGALLAWGDHEGRVILREAGGGGRARVLREATTKPIRTVAFSPDGRTLGVADPAGAGDALLFDVATGAERGRLPGGSLGLVALAFAPDGRTAATAGIDRTVRLWDLGAMREVAAIYEGRVLKSAAFSPDGRWLACSSGEEIRLVDLQHPPGTDRRVARADSVH